MHWVHSHSLFWIKISVTESTIWATASGRILLARYLEGGRLDEGVIQVPGENKKLSATVGHLSKNAGGLKVLPPAARASSIKHLITWGEIYCEIIYSQMKLFFFSMRGRGPLPGGWRVFDQQSNAKKGQYVDIFYNITEWPQECHCCKCWGGLPNAPCWQTVEKKTLGASKYSSDIITYHISTVIDFFYNVIQIIYWPGWCRHRWLAALKASPTSPRPLLTFHHWVVKSSFNSLWTCFGAKRMENVNFGTCFQGAVGVSPASNFQRLPWKSSKWHSPQPPRLRLNYEYCQNVVDTSPSF